MDAKKYSFLKPMPGFLVLKEVEDEVKGKTLASGSDSESRAYGYVVAVPEEVGLGINLGDLVCYSEFEGQELFKYGQVKEDHLIAIRTEHIILKIEPEEVNQ